MPAGRATTPQASTTRARSQRSASREVTASPANTRGAGRRRGAGQASVDEPGVPASAPAAGAIRGARGKKDAVALPPVDEDPRASADNDGVPTDPQLEEPSVLSNVSGTTAVSPNSAQADTTERTFDDVCYALPHLHEAAEDLLEVLAPENATAEDLGLIVDELKTSGSRSSLGLKRCADSLATQLGSLTEGRYINPTVFLRSVLKSGVLAKLDSSPWRPDDILYKANLANLVRHLATQERDADDTYDLLDGLDPIMPSFFVSAFGTTEDGQAPVGASTLLRQTFDVALQLRTQLLVLQLIRSSGDADSDPSELIDSVFFKAAERRGPPQVRGWDFPQFSDAGLTKAGLKTEMLKRVERVRSHLSEEGVVDLDSLAADFGWRPFQVSVLDWARMRNRELNGAMEARGGARALVKELKRTVEPSSTKSTPLVKRNNGAQAAARRRTYPATAPMQQDLLEAAANKRYDSSDLALLKALGKNNGFSGLSTIPAIPEDIAQANTAPADFGAQDDTDAGIIRQQYTGPETDQYEEDYDQATDPALLGTSRGLPEWTNRVLEAAAQHDRHNQENLERQRSFIDRQNGAHRVEFGDGFTQASQSATSAQRHMASSALARAGYATGKRRAGIDSDEPEMSQDAGFQYDDRNIDYTERRRMIPAPENRAPVANMTGPSPRKRARFQTYPEEGLYDDDVTYENGNDVAGTSGEQYQRAKLLAKDASKRASLSQGLLMRATSASGDRAVGRGAGNPTKRKWQPNQESELIEYIKEFGCKWAEISKQDKMRRGLLEQWSQIDLKDKAINIRVDWLKSRTTEPKNFEYISLRQRDKDKLRAMGIEVPEPVGR